MGMALGISGAGAGEDGGLRIPDRIDSANTSDGKENVHIFHLGCNPAKDRYTMAEFETGSLSSRSP